MPHPAQPMSLTEIEQTVLAEFIDPEADQYTAVPLIVVGQPLRYLARSDLAGCLALARLLHQQERLMTVKLQRFYAVDPPSDYGQLLRHICRERLAAINALRGFHPAES